MGGRNGLRGVAVAGVGLHPFGRFPEKSTGEMVEEATAAALTDAGLDFDAVDVAYYGHVYDQGPCPAGRFVPGQFGLTGVPVVNVENACASGTTAIWQAFWMIATGAVEVALVVGAERVPRGPVMSSAAGDLGRYIGDDHMMATYALRMQEYMHRHSASPDAIAQVAVKAHRNGALNEFAHHSEETTLAEVLDSRMIADPLTLLQCCPTSEGAAAAVLRASDGADSRASRSPRIRSVALRTDRYAARKVHTTDGTHAAAAEAYEMAGLAPADVDLAQVHDAATIGELMRVEALGLIPEGEAWRATADGATAIDGRIPVNTDGGLLSMGHPFGATGIRQLHETVQQLRGLAGDRQVRDASAGLIQCSGAGGVSAVAIVTDR